MKTEIEFGARGPARTGFGERKLTPILTFAAPAAEISCLALPG
jgi:hypothetical protein